MSKPYRTMEKSFLKTGMTEKIYVKDEDGVIIDEDFKQVKYLANTKEEFFLVYTSLIGVLEQLSSPEIKVYCYLLKNYIIGSEIALPKGMKELIGAKQNLGLGTIDNALSVLTDKGLIYKTQRAIYKINPRYAFKGSTASRNALLKFVLEVECPDC